MRRARQALAWFLTGALAASIWMLLDPGRANATGNTIEWTGTGVVVNHTTDRTYYVGTYSVDTPTCTHSGQSQDECTPQTLVDSAIIPAGTPEGQEVQLTAPGTCMLQWDAATSPLAPHLGKGEYTPGYRYGYRVPTGLPCQQESPPAPTPSGTPSTPAPAPAPSAPATPTPSASTPTSSAPTTPASTHSHPAPAPTTRASTPPVKRAVRHEAPIPRPTVSGASDATPAGLPVSPVAQEGSLAYTGSGNTGVLLAVGLGSVAAGACLLALSRRRSR